MTTKSSTATASTTNTNTTKVSPTKDCSALLNHPKLWRARELATQQGQTRQSMSSGFEQLDEHLPDHGWPASALMEIMLPSAGLGELRLLIPAIRHLSQTQARWVAWVNPPFIPYAPALKALGVDIDKILLIHPKTHADTLWALERACKSGSCSAALAWLNDKQLKFKDTQRLQVATKQGNTMTCLFRPGHQLAANPDLQASSSMAELRLLVRSFRDGDIQLDILKRRGGWPITDLSIPVGEVTRTKQRNPLEIRDQLELWRALRTPAQTIEPDPLSITGADQDRHAIDALILPERSVHKAIDVALH